MFLKIDDSNSYLLNIGSQSVFSGDLCHLSIHEDTDEPLQYFQLRMLGDWIVWIPVLGRRNYRISEPSLFDQKLLPVFSLSEWKEFESAYNIGGFKIPDISCREIFELLSEFHPSQLFQVRKQNEIGLKDEIIDCVIANFDSPPTAQELAAFVKRSSVYSYPMVWQAVQPVGVVQLLVGQEMWPLFFSENGKVGIYLEELGVTGRA